MSKKNKRSSVGSLKDLIVYPRPNSNKSLEDLKTIGLTLSANDAIELADLLLQAVVDGAKKIDLTGYRKDNRVTVTFK